MAHQTNSARDEKVSRLELKTTFAATDKETMTMQTKSKHSYKIYFHSNIEILEDEQTIVGISEKRWSKIIYKENIITRKGIVEFDDHKTDINTVLVDESRNLLLSSEENEGNGKVMQYNLDSGHLMKEYDALEIGTVICSIQISNLCFFGGNDHKIRVIDLEAEDYLGDAIETSIASIYHMELCLVDSQNPQMVLSVDGRDQENSDEKELKTDCFNITKLVKKMRVCQEDRLLYKLIQTKLKKTEDKMEQKEFEFDSVEVMRQKLGKELEKTQEELQSEREKNAKLRQEREKELDKLRTENTCQGKEIRTLSNKLEQSEKSCSQQKEDAQNRIKGLETENADLKVELQKLEEEYGNERVKYSKEKADLTEKLKQITENEADKNSKLVELDQAFKNKKSELENVKFASENEIKRLKLELEESKNEVNESESHKLKLSNKIENLEKSLKIEEKKNRELEQKEVEFRIQIKKNEAQIEKLKNKNKNENMNWNREMEMKDEMIKNLISQREEISLELAEATSRLNEKKLDDLKQLSESQIKVQSLDIEKKNLREKKYKLESEASEHKKQIMELQSQKTDSQKVVEELRRKIEGLECSLKKMEEGQTILEERSSKSEEENKQLRRENSRLSTENQKLSAKLKILENANQNLEEKKENQNELNEQLSKAKKDLEILREQEIRKIKENEQQLLEQVKTQRFNLKSERKLKKKMLNECNQQIEKYKVEFRDLTAKNEHLIELWEKDKLSHLNKCHQNDQIVQSLQTDNRKILEILKKIESNDEQGYVTIKHETAPSEGINEALIIKMNSIFDLISQAWSHVENINYLNSQSTKELKDFIKRILIMSNNFYRFEK